MPLGKDVGANIHEMAHSPKHKKRVSKFGKKHAHEIEVAASANAASRKSKKGKRKAKHSGTRRSGRS
jgi:hypothetical protein